MFGNSLLNKDKENGSAPKPPPRKRTGGWAEESSNPTNLEKPLSILRLERQESDEDVPDIPELESKGGTQLDYKTASESLNKVATFKELDEDISNKTGAFAFLQDVDLHPLTKHLLPESDLKEADKVWDWDVLFAEIGPELDRGKEVPK